MFIIDAHLDLAWNAVEWNRDLQQPIKDINDREKGMSDKPGRGNGTVSIPELKKRKYWAGGGDTDCKICCSG